MGLNYRTRKRKFLKSLIVHILHFELTIACSMECNCRFQLCKITITCFFIQIFRGNVVQGDFLLCVLFCSMSGLGYLCTKIEWII